MDLIPALLAFHLAGKATHITVQSVGVDLMFSDVGTESCLHQTRVKHEVSRYLDTGVC